jgi:hypothetical protein
MQPVQFDEKEYESALYGDLRAGKRGHWALGQVLEQYLGFDYGVSTMDRVLFELHGIRDHVAGIVPYEDLLANSSTPSPRSYKAALPRSQLLHPNKAASAWSSPVEQASGARG